MELGLSLGDASTTVGFLKETKSIDQNSGKMAGLNFCMGLGLGSAAARNQEPNDKAQEISGGDDDDDEASQGDEESDGDNQGKNRVLQLDLLPLVPVNPRRQIPSHLIQPLPWSSDNGSSENGPSGNIGPPASARELDVNRPPVVSAAEEVSSANSVGSPFTHMDLGAYSNGRGINGNLQLLGGGGGRRSLELEPAAGNDASEAERASSRASDDDESGPHARKKLRLSKQQSAFLEETFKEHNTLNPKQKLALAKQLNLRPRQVEVWFQNRRARTKLKQTEVDCEYLKRCCETLTEENRRLHKELQELRALKTSNPFHLQLPATTLTMCPSCERVAAAPPPPPKAAAAVDSIPFPLARPRFHPFPSNPANHANNNQPATS